MDYLPAESDTGMFGGNSNWRGPIWMPVNALIIRALLSVLPLLWRQLQDRMSHGLRQDDEPLRGQPRKSPIGLTSIFLRDEDGRRPVYGGTEKFQDDPHWRDYILFYEYFHGDNGAGLGRATRPVGPGWWRR